MIAGIHWGLCHKCKEERVIGPKFIGIIRYIYLCHDCYEQQNQDES